MPTLTRSWTSSQNNVPSDQTTTSAQAKEILLDMKNQMVNAGWTVTQSSDASTTNDSDLWDTVADITGDAGVHSWIVLKSPEGYPTDGNFVYFAIDYDSASDWRCSFAVRGDADWTGLTTSSSPYDNDTGSTSRWNQMYLVANSAGTVGNLKYNSTYSDIGDFIYYINEDGTGLNRFAIIINKLSNTQSVDDFPVSILVRGNNTTTLSWSADALYYAGWTPSYSYVFGLHYSTGVGGKEAWGFPSDTTTWGSYYGSNTGDDIGGILPAIPIVVGSGIAGSTGVRGTLTDIWAANANSEVFDPGTVQPAIGAITAGIIGCVWVPCDVAPDFGP